MTKPSKTFRIRGWKKGLLLRRSMKRLVSAEAHGGYGRSAPFAASQEEAFAAESPQPCGQGVRCRGDSEHDRRRERGSLSSPLFGSDDRPECRIARCQDEAANLEPNQPQRAFPDGRT